MQSYSLSTMAQRMPNTTAMFPVIHESAGLQRSYLAELRRFLKSASGSVRDIILPSYQRRALVTDTNEDDFKNFENILAALVRATQQVIRGFLDLEGKRHTERFVEASRRAFGIDLKGIVTGEQLSDYLDQVALRNAGLVKGMSDDLAKRIRTITTNALVNGETVGQLQKKLKHELGVTDSRARLIARDQTAKLNAELNKKRHQQAGIEEYIWRTSKDERVRDRHKKINGKKFKYGEPTPAEQGLEPGQPIQCRCIAQAVVRF